MNRIKLLIGALICLSLTFASASPAHAASYWTENPNLSVEFHQGSDWGKLNANHTELTPRDGECDGNSVMFYLRKDTVGGYTFRQVFDNNGCDTGGGSETINPYNWDTVKFCEVHNDGWYCTPVYYLPWGN